MAKISSGSVLFGKYRIERLLGKGGFSRVYLAFHLHLGVYRALKVLTRGGSITTGNLNRVAQRFRLEAQLGAHFANVPYIVRVYDFESDRDRGLLALVMEYMPGGSLQGRIREARRTGLPGLPVDFVVKTAYHAALGLSVLHRANLVHRDIKPSNLLYDAQENAKIADLGVVQIPQGITRRTQLGDAAPRHPGTREYMSPEQATTLDYLPPASDIYSLGATLFEALTLRQYKQLRPGTRVAQFRPDVPLWLDDLLARMLAEDPKSRPWDGGELAQIIRRQQEHPGTVLFPAQTDFSTEDSIAEETEEASTALESHIPSSHARLTRAKRSGRHSALLPRDMAPALEPTRQAMPATRSRPVWYSQGLLFVLFLVMCSLLALFMGGFLAWSRLRTVQIRDSISVTSVISQQSVSAGSKSSPTSTPTPLLEGESSGLSLTQVPTPTLLLVPSPSPLAVTAQAVPLFPDSQRYGILGSLTFMRTYVLVFDRSHWVIRETDFEHPNWAISIVSREESACHLYIEPPRDYIGETKRKTTLYGFKMQSLNLFVEEEDRWGTVFWGPLLPVNENEIVGIGGFAAGFVSSGATIEKCNRLVVPVLGTMQYREDVAQQCSLIARSPYQPGDTFTLQREVQAYHWPRWAMSAWKGSLPSGLTLQVIGTPVCAATPQGPTLAWPVKWPGGTGWVLQAELEGKLSKPPSKAFPEGEPPVMWRKWCAEAPPSWLAVGVRGEVCTREDRVRVRSKPGRRAGRIAWAYPGDRFVVIDGPECGDGWVWWQVRLDDGTIGWMAEGGDERDPKFLCPLAP